jgi:branched-chain amino acid aminotransferase
MEPTDKIWMSGKYVNWNDAKIHVINHTLHYGTGVFEGIRCYNTVKGPAVFRLREHVERLLNSAELYKMKVPYTYEKISEVIKETIRINKMKECYIRPLVYYGYKKMGVNPIGNPVEVMVAVWPWGAYLGEEGLKKGIRCTLTKWCRIDPRTMPPQAKATANYANAALAKMDALNRGFDESIMHNTSGTICEGSGENLFIVKNKVVKTTSEESGALKGITQASVIQIAQDLGFQVKIGLITKEELLNADEVFLTGTAAEVTPVREIDGKIYGSGVRGPITEKLQSKFFEIVNGKDDKYMEWLAFVEKT